MTSPPPAGVERSIQVRLNNLSLAGGRPEHGWLVFDVEPGQLAVGENLVGVSADDPSRDKEEALRVELLELDVRYR